MTEQIDRESEESEQEVQAAESFIVRKKVTYVPSDSLKALEIRQFLSSVLLLAAGVFMGVITNQEIESLTFQAYLVSGILLLLVGTMIFWISVHGQIIQWEKEKEPISVLRVRQLLQTAQDLLGHPLSEEETQEMIENLKKKRKI